MVFKIPFNPHHFMIYFPILGGDKGEIIVTVAHNRT